MPFSNTDPLNLIFHLCITMKRKRDTMHGRLAELVLVEVKAAEEADHLKDCEKDDKC